MSRFGGEVWGGLCVAVTCHVNDLLDGHVVLDLECLDRIYCNAYVPNLQVGGQVVSFLTRIWAVWCPRRQC
jgi:hypothetical protein